MKSLLAGLLLLGFVSSANAATYNFAYNFFDGNVVSGSFDGTQNGNLVEGISNISMFFNSTAYTTPLYASGWNGTNWTTGNGVASFDGLQSNLLFIDVNYPTVNTYTQYFYIRSTSLFDAFAYLPAIGGVADDTGSRYDASRWSLNAVNVPESSSLYLLAFGMLGLFGTARRKA